MYIFIYTKIYTYPRKSRGLRVWLPGWIVHLWSWPQVIWRVRAFWYDIGLFRLLLCLQRWASLNHQLYTLVICWLGLVVILENHQQVINKQQENSSNRSLCNCSKPLPYLCLCSCVNTETWLRYWSMESAWLPMCFFVFYPYLLSVIFTWLHSIDVCMYKIYTV